VNGERKAGIDEGSYRSQQPLFVVPEGLRCSGDQDNPSPVAVDVALEEGDAVLLRCCLHRPDEVVERLRRCPCPLRGDQVVGPREADERDGCVSMLALQRADLEQLDAERSGDGRLERDPLDVRERIHGALDRRRRPQQPARSFVVPGHLAVEEVRQLRAEQNLACLRGCLHLHRAARRRAHDEELAMRLPDEEDVEGAGVEPGVHPQLHRAGRRPGPTDCPERTLHLERCPRRPGGMSLTVEEQEQGVAAELEQAPTLRIGDAEERCKGGVHHLCDLLRALAATAGEAIGHRGESRDVDEGDRALDLAPRPRRLVAQPLEGQPWNERDELAGRRRPGCQRRGHAVILSYPATVAKARARPSERASLTECLRAHNAIPPERGRPIRRNGR